MPEDSELLRLYAHEGSEDAFRELVNRRITLVYGSAFRQLGDANRAREVVQLVFTDLARKASSLCRRPVLASWLYTSTHFAVAKLRRAETRQRIRDHEAHLMHETNHDGAMDEEWERLRPVLDEELHGLDRRDREAVLMRYFESKSFSAIGETLSLSEDAARKRVERALYRLQVRLATKGIRSTAAALSIALAEQAAVAAPADLAGTVAGTALVQSAAGAAGTGIVNLMTTTKTALVAATLLAAIAIGSAAYEYAQERSMSSELAGLQAESDASSQRAKAREGEAAAAEQERTAARNSSRDAAAAKIAAEAKGIALMQAAKLRGNAFMEHHPEVKAALLEYVDAGNHAKYSPLYSSLGLTQEQIHQMEVLLRTGRAFGRLGPDGEVTLAPPDQLPYAEQQEQLKALLGDPGFEQYKEFSAALPARGVVSDLAGLLMTGDSPLTTGQAQQLVGILSASADLKEQYKVDWPSVYGAAQGILSPAQMQMLQAVGTRAQGWQKVEASIH